MSGRDHSDDSSGNLAAGEPTVPEFTVDSSHPRTPDPNDTQQDAQATRRSQQDQNVTNDPARRSGQNGISHGAADGDTMDDPWAPRSLDRPAGSDLDITKQEPHVADKKSDANPFGLDKTLLEPHAQAREENPDAPDTTADLLHELFQSAMSNAAVVRKDTAASAAKPSNQSQADNLFESRFEILTELGSGGMGTVFKAHDIELDRIIAIKVLNLVGRDADARIQRFRQEARAAAKLNHPNIIKIHDLHTAATGEQYIQFEYVEGCSLSNLLAGFKKKNVLMPIKTVLDCAIQSLAALECMHENNIVHRDVKPANIMLEKKTNARGLANTPKDVLEEGARTAKLDEYPDVDYRVKLVDFGLAKIRDEDDNTMMSITRKGQAVGTAAYMSPEQCGGERVDGCSDIYSLGCILFEMLTGRVPFRGGDSAETMRLHQNAAIPQLSLERPTLAEVDKFERIVNKMLAKQRIDRYRTAKEAKDDLKELYIGIKSGAIMEALKSEKGQNVPNAQNLPGELHPNVPTVDKPGGGFDDLQAVPGASDSTVADLYDQYAHKKQNDVSSRGASQADPQNAERKIYADPLAQEETVQESFGQKQQVYPDPLAIDATQPSAHSRPSAADSKGSSAAGVNTNWGPISGTPPSSSSSKQQHSTPTHKKPGQGFSEGDLFARKYEVKGHIGQGGMGVVYKAIDLVLGRTVAIKFLKGKSGISQMEMSRFQQEAKAIASLNHTNIIRVHDMSVTDEGDPFFVLEYLEGHALSSEIRGKKKLPLERALSIVSQVCDALQHAHDYGVIHRDIKPSNLMIVPQKDGTESVKLLDFGIAKLNPIDEETLLKLTKTGELFGSPHYMSPEQCSGKEVGGQSDIYSLGIVLFELICGVPPFSGQSPFDTLDKHKNAPTPSVLGYRPDLPASQMVDDLLSKMTAKEPSDRYQNPGEVKIAIQEIQKKLDTTKPQNAGTALLPNALNDLNGKIKKKLALVLIALASLCAIPLIMSVVSNLTATKAPPAVALKSWKTYDLKGQKLFNTGAYQSAEKEYLLAYEKAKTEKTAVGKVHLYTTLQELKMLYTAWNKSNRVEWASGELVNSEVRISTRTISRVSWSDVLGLASEAKNDDLEKILDGAIDLTVSGNAKSIEKNTSEMLSSLKKKLERLPNSELAIDQLIILEAFQNLKDQKPFPAETSIAISRLTKKTVDSISPEMANVLVEVGFIQPDVDLRKLEDLSNYAVVHSRHSFNRLAALRNLSKIYWYSGRMAAAAERMDQCIDEAQKLEPRNYPFLYRAITLRAELYSAKHSYSLANPLYARALAISECWQISVSDYGESGSIATDFCRYALAKNYIAAGRYDEGERIVSGLLANQDLPFDLKVGCYRELGLLYLRKKQLSRAEECISIAIKLYKPKKSLTRFQRDDLNAALNDLSRVRKEKLDGGAIRSSDTLAD